MQERKSKINTIMKLSIIAGLYVVLTYAFSFISFGKIQFRIAEILMLLCFFNKKYSIALILGCFIANLFSPYGLPDIIFGTLATAIACGGLVLFKGHHLWLASLSVPFGNIIVGIEITLVNNLPLNAGIITTLGVLLGEFVVASLIGVHIFKWLMKNEIIKNLILNI